MLQSPYLVVYVIMLSSVAVDMSSSENSGNTAGCYYKGEYYTGNWTDGCEFNCSCIKPDSGFYKCTTRCPVYRDVPTGCILSLPPGEECCKQPDCSAVTSNHNNNNDADNNDKNTTITDVNSAADNITDKDGGKGCNYKGHYYHGNWTDGCEFSCTCKDTVSGLYRCTARCKEYSDLNPGCELKLPPNEECCLEAVCNSTETQTADDNMPVELPQQDTTNVTSVSVTNTTGAEQEAIVSYETVTAPEITAATYTVKSTQRLADIFSKFGPVNLFSARKVPVSKATENETRHAPKHTDLRPGLDYHPTSTENKGTVKQNLAYGLGGVCSYKGLNYTQEEKWFDGCNYVCTCMNARFGVYKCIDRCPRYNALPVGCVNRRSRSDKCCFEPDCRFGSVVRRDKYSEPMWTLSQLHPIRSTEMSPLKQMFNKRMDLKSVDIGRGRYSSLAGYFQWAPMHLNKTNKLVPKIEYIRKRQPPSFTRRFPTSKKHDRYSDMESNINPEVVKTGKRFTDYSSTDLASNDVTTSVAGNDAAISSNTGKSDVAKSNAEANDLVTTKLLNYSAVDSKSLNKEIAKANPLKADIVNTKDNTTGSTISTGVVINPINSNAVKDTIMSNGQLSNTEYSRDVETSAVKSNEVKKEFVLKQLMSILDISINDIPAVRDVPNIQMNYSTVPTTNRSNIQVSTNASEPSVKPISGNSVPKWNHTGAIDISINNSAVNVTDHSKAQYVTVRSKPEKVTTTETVSHSLNEIINDNQNNMTININSTKTKLLKRLDSEHQTITGKLGHVKTKTFMHSKTGNPNKNVLGNLLKAKQEVGQLKTTTPKSSTKPMYRTMRTNTGVFQVSVVDGTITPFRKPIVGVLSKMLLSTRKRKTFQKESTATQGDCLYNGRFYTKGELWFDKCDFVCKCNGDGQYTCHQRCPGHEYIPRGCSMLKPNIQACCDILVCKNSETDNNV